jgi:protein ImuB
LQGNGTATSELASPVVKLRLIPEQVDPVGAHVDGLWGGGPDERIHRALSRVQSMLGHGAVVSPVIGGGRGYADRQTLIPWGNPPIPARPSDAPWPGSLPASSGTPNRWPTPVPTTVYPVPFPAQVLAADGRPVSVSARSVLSGEPAGFRLDPAPQVADSNKLHPITTWAGPWLVEERWWDEDTANRLARFQFVTADGRAWLFVVRNTNWHLEASYD